ncbi:MAG: CvpA family protein [Spirochaetales bacterium]|nr:CvpA family protein [Spirochaetales bacterium]
MKINPLDIVFIVLIGAGAIRCAFKGFIAEIMSFAALILGVVAAVFFSKAGAGLIDTYVGFSNWNQIIAFLVIFIVVYLLVKLLEGILHRILDKIQLERLDRVLGFFLGLVEGALAVVLIIYIMRVQPIFDLQALLDKSVISRFVLEIIPLVPQAEGMGIDV